MTAARSPGSATDVHFRTAGQLVLLVAVLRLVSAFTMPAGTGPAGDQLTASTILLIGHGLVYLFGARLRARSGAVAYVGIQGTLVASIALFSLSLWLSIALFATLGVHVFTLLRHRPSVVWIAFTSILGFGVTTSLGGSAYRGAVIALALAGAGVAVSAVSGGWNRHRRR